MHSILIIQFFVLNIVWSCQNCLKYMRSRWTGHLLKVSYCGRATPRNKISLSRSILDPRPHMRVLNFSFCYFLLYLLLFKYNLICFISFNCSISSLSAWWRLDRSRPNKKVRPLLTAHVLVTTKYRPRWLAVATMIAYMAWGLPTTTPCL